MQHRQLLYAPESWAGSTLNSFAHMFYSILSKFAVTRDENKTNYTFNRYSLLKDRHFLHNSAARDTLGTLCSRPHSCSRKACSRISFPWDSLLSATHPWMSPSLTGAPLSRPLHETEYLTGAGRQTLLGAFGSINPLILIARQYTKHQYPILKTKLNQVSE